MANLQSVFPKAVNVLGEQKNPIQSLWRNVLIVALEDAMGKGFRCYGMSDRNYYNSYSIQYTITYRKILIVEHIIYLDY